MKIFYFTSTGNCLDVAKNFDAELYSIPQVLKNKNLNFEDDKIGIIFPTYAISTPSIVVEFLEKVTLKSPYIFVIATNGGASFGVLNQFIGIAKKQNINISYANNITMADNYIPFFDMNESIKKTPSSTINENIKKLVDDVNSNKTTLDTKNPLLGFSSTLGYKALKLAKNSHYKMFNVEPHCTLCGVCQNVCPTKNISVAEKVNYNTNCISCLACTHACPSNAIRVKKEKSKARYRNKNVSLNEIISSNNQY